MYVSRCELGVVWNSTCKYTKNFAEVTSAKPSIIVKEKSMGLTGRK